MIATQSSIDEFAYTAWRNGAVGPDKRTNFGEHLIGMPQSLTQDFDQAGPGASADRSLPSKTASSPNTSPG